MRIIVNVKTVYGRDLIYPVCENAKAFARISKNETLTVEVLKEIKALGFGLIFEAKKVQL